MTSSGDLSVRIPEVPAAVRPGSQRHEMHAACCKSQVAVCTRHTPPHPLHRHTPCAQTAAECKTGRAFKETPLASGESYQPLAPRPLAQRRGRARLGPGTSHTVHVLLFRRLPDGLRARRRAHRLARIVLAPVRDVDNAFFRWGRVT